VSTDDPLRLLKQRLGYEFAEEELLCTALTHRSYAHESRGAEDNERLEYLGDAVIDLVVSEELFHRLPGRREGELSRARAALVNEAALAAVAREVGLGTHLRLGRGEHKTGGEDKDSILCGAFEAVIGALLIDGGIETCRRLLIELLGGALRRVEDSARVDRDPKTSLQEWLVGRRRISPSYRVLSEHGPPHRRTFTVAVSEGDAVLAVGSGASKKESEQRAAQAALLHLGRMEGLAR